MILDGYLNPQETVKNIGNSKELDNYKSLFFPQLLSMHTIYSKKKYDIAFGICNIWRHNKYDNYSIKDKGE